MSPFQDVTSSDLNNLGKKKKNKDGFDLFKISIHKRKYFASILPFIQTSYVSENILSDVIHFPT